MPLSKRLNDSGGHFPHPLLLPYLESVWGSFRQLTYLGAVTAIFTCQVLTTARQSHLEFFFPDASPVLLFDQGFVRQIVLVYTDAKGTNEKTGL